jgi:hypothetical protein
VVAGGTAIAAVLIHHGAGVHVFNIKMLQLMLGFYLPYLKKAMETFSLVTDTRDF